MQRTKYDEVIGYDHDGHAVILNQIFRYADGFHGATGAIVELISQEQYDDATTDEALMEYGEEVWRLDAGSSNGTTLGLEEWVEQAHGDLIEGMFDNADGYLIPEGDHVTTNCVGAGRIFPDALDTLVTIVRPDLVAAIREAEAQ